MSKSRISKRPFNEKKSKIPRPLNSFMIFRVENHAEVSLEYPGATHQEISKKLSKKWKDLSPQYKQIYIDRAIAAKEEHKLLYPHYKYRPRKRTTPPPKASTNATIQNQSTNKASQLESHSISHFNENVSCLTAIATASNATATPPQDLFFQGINLTLDQMGNEHDQVVIDSPYNDNLLLPPTMNEPFYQNPSASPSAYSTMSQFSTLSFSASSEYDSSVSQAPKLSNGSSIHPYDCGSQNIQPYYYCQPLSLDIPVTYEYPQNVVYHQQLDPVVSPFNIYPRPILNYTPFIPPPDIEFSEVHENPYPPAIVLDHTSTMTEENHTQLCDSLGSFYAENNTLPTSAPLLTQPFYYTDF